MAPDRFRKQLGFAGLCAAPFTLLTAVPALAQGLVPVHLGGIAPFAVAIGAGGFALLAMALVRTLLKDSRAARRRAAEQIADLRALVDEYESLIAGSRELTILWQGHDSPRILGQAAAVLPAGRQPQSVLNFHTWLGAAETNRLTTQVEDLRMHGHAFATSLDTLDGRIVRANGWVMGDAVALRLRPAHSQPNDGKALAAVAQGADRESARAILELLTKPAYLRDDQHRLIYANGPYQALAKAMGKACPPGEPCELLDATRLAAHLKAAGQGVEPVTLALDFATHGRFELVEFPLPGGRAGYLRPVGEAARPAATAEAGVNHIGGIIEALGTPIAIFNAKRELVQFNAAYARLWGLEPRFLTPGLDERAILDKLRTEGMLPNQVDYHTWRSKHLESYTRKEPHEAEPWHLPDGRTIKVISAPAGPSGGVIYVFEDMTERLELESTNKAFTNVLRETIMALNEAVAVFGTNGRLTLSNPQLSKLWKLPMNELGNHPHIDQLAEASGRAIPEDGATIWRDLKRTIIDLNPTRTDRTGRINRSDGRLVDYAITRLPDGQTMMTFLDVTESASYSKVLKERNDALVAADRLKDAFVENVSYELRSPLTNIIGFADLLAGTEGGTLNERQREYIDYIRASSVTLGVLIDNILDLASVDAGIAELNPEALDVPALVDKARAGIAATFPEVSGEAPHLVVDIAPDLPDFIGDGTRIVQVLYNLLSNAARFSPPGGEIRLTVAHRGDRMLFVIEDEGPGITDEMKAAILTRLDTPAAGGRQRGAGLGLSIVRTFVNMHGGTISAEKREPKGSRIIVNLPLDSAMAGVAE
ncbi:sensor histidine kinase [Devosia sediminis]|uniref:histidine kinase n=1 Tax=Devosia sediminis TaxID=2798801 RepID=A0A934J1N4_9HYPH|nr:ATP-binding protein [Devosia sediminis]MBJ3785984.1 PAS-domain containing protein [Devosia sediminis]